MSGRFVWCVVMAGVVAYMGCTGSMSAEAIEKLALVVATFYFTKKMVEAKA